MNEINESERIHIIFLELEYRAFFRQLCVCLIQTKLSFPICTGLKFVSTVRPDQREVWGQRETI